MKKNSFQESQLYVIVDSASLKGRDPLEVAEAAIEGGADVIQWRDKTAPDGCFLETALRLRKLTRRRGVLFVVNDRVDAALMAQADAVHLGQEDLPAASVRKWAGERLLIGRSTHSLPEALEAQHQGCDYIGVGPVFATPTKPDTPAVGLELVRRVRPKISIPWFAIGGIDFGNVGEVLSAGANRIAVVRAVGSASDPEKAASSFKRQMMKHRTLF